MRITKYHHSCLLVEDHNTTILIDPGSYTESSEQELLNLKKLNAILITHEHLDHMSPPLIKKLQEKFPDVNIISNKSVVALLNREDLEARSEEIPNVSMETIKHERLWFGEPPENTVFTLFSRLTHPGDSFHFTQSAEILALPITAPWGSTVQAIEKALEIKPKVIVPIHDALWKDEVRKSFYPRLSDFFSQHQIEFKGIESGKPVEV